MHGLQHSARWARCLAIGGLAALLFTSNALASDDSDRRIANRVDADVALVSSDGLQAARWEIQRPGATFVKLHFSAFMLPDGVAVEVSSPDGSERYYYWRGHKDAHTWDARQGDDGRTRFSAMSITGDTAVVRLIGQLGRLNPGMHRVEIDHYLAGFRRDESPVPTSTLQRALGDSTSKPEMTCGINERYDAVCWKGSHQAEFETAYAVAVLVTATGVECTAWRAGPDNRMFTAQHCVGNQDDLTGAEIWFNYQATSCGGSSTTPPVKVTGGEFLAGDGTLDFGLFTVNDFESIAQFGYLGLEVREGMLGEGIFIPQHGLGRPAQISLESDMNASGYCEIDNVSKNGYGKDTDIGYYCDTTTSSSGSPVVTADSGRVIALHHLGGCLNSASKMKLIWSKVSGHFGGKVPSGDSTWTGGDWAEQTGGNQLPEAWFEHACEGLTCDFDASGSEDLDGSITSWDWSMGDGKSRSGAAVTHTFSAAGTYTVRLTVTDDAGGQDVLSERITVEAPNAPPTANFSFACDATACEFDGGSSTDADGSIANYAWSLGDGTSRSGPVVSHTYGKEGTYSVKLTVADNQGAKTSKSRSVTVTVPEEPPAQEPPEQEPPEQEPEQEPPEEEPGQEPPAQEPPEQEPEEEPANRAPYASFTSSCNALACTFDAGSSRDGDGYVAKFTWKLGDGASGEGRTLAHDFAKPGTYTVTLTITDNGGATDTIARVVEVTGKKPIQLQVDGSSFKGKVLAVLKWSGAESQNVDIYRNGKLLASTKNNGVHIDKALLKSAKTMSYRLCEQGSSNCSGEVPLR